MLRKIQRASPICEMKKEITLTPLRLRDTSLFERLPLIGWLSPGRVAKIKAIRQAGWDTAETLQITPLLSRKPGHRSAGQRQRAATGGRQRNPGHFRQSPVASVAPLAQIDRRTQVSAG